MKDIINIIIDKEDISILDKYSSNNEEEYDRIKNVIIKFINITKPIYISGRIKLEELIEIVRYFYDEYQKNVLIIEYIKNGKLSEISEQILYEEVKQITYRKIEEFNIRNDETNSSKSEVKHYTKKNHSIISDEGFIQPLLLAVLTFVIEISPIIYILIRTMD